MRIRDQKESLFATGFEYHIFYPLDYQEYLCRLGSLASPPAQAESLYLEWLDQYYHRAGIFYQAQYYRLQRLADRSFRRSYGLEEDCRLDPYQEQWDDYCASIDLQAHYADYRDLSEEVANARNRLRGELEKLDLAEQLERKLSESHPNLSEVNALWFDMTIHNSEEVVFDLRKLPYKLYLKTKHWAKVRAAQMLIHKAVCQVPSHYVIGESWYYSDWETDINVHHLTYKNRGNERYSDLVLLCANHHRALHEKSDIDMGSGVAFLDDN